jgi:hypothetical protein
MKRMPSNLAAAISTPEKTAILGMALGRHKSKLSENMFAKHA